MKSPVNINTFSNRFAKHLYTKGEDNDEVFKVLNHCLDYLNVRTVKQKSIEEDISVQRVYKKHNCKINTILGLKIIIDNE